MNRRRTWFAISAAMKAACFALLVLPIVVKLIILHAIEGHEITISSDQVTSLRATIPGKHNDRFTKEVVCLIGLTDGKFVSVVESCAQVRALLEER